MSFFECVGMSRLVLTTEKKTTLMSILNMTHKVLKFQTHLDLMTYFNLQPAVPKGTAGDHKLWLMEAVQHKATKTPLLRDNV